MAATATTTPASTTATSTSTDDKTMGILAHVLMIVTGFLGPLILYLVKKDQGGAAVHHAREALNFSILATIAYFVAWILTAVSFGLLFFLPLLVWVGMLIFGIMGAMAANNGQLYRYPVSLRLVK
jgi:uncharacterized protein